MEGFLILIALILFIVILSKNNSHHKEINNSLDAIHQKLNQLKKELSSLQNLEIKPNEEVKLTPNVDKPIEQKPIITPQKPMAADAVSKPIAVPKPIPITKPIKPKALVAPKKSWFETFKENNPDLEKFIGENLINKIGILILVLGIRC